MKHLLTFIIKNKNNKVLIHSTHRYGLPIAYSDSEKCTLEILNRIKKRYALDNLKIIKKKKLTYLDKNKRKHSKIVIICKTTAQSNIKYVLWANVSAFRTTSKNKFARGFVQRTVLDSLK